MVYVFIHGLGQSSSSWDNVISYLPRHYRATCPDLVRMVNHKDVTYNNLYNSFVKYCEDIDEPLHLCGLSLGGILALNYVVDFPDKVKSLVLIGAQYEMPKLLLKFQNSIFRFMPKSAFGKMGFKKEHFIQLTNSMVDLNFSKDLIDISCDTLIVCGEKDHANRNASKNLLELIPKSKIQFITNASHEINVQEPKKLAEILEDFYENSRIYISNRSIND